MLILSNKLKYWQISGQHYKVLPIKDLLTPILGVLEWGFPFGVSQFCKNLGLNCLCLIKIGAHFSMGKIIYWVGNFGQWAG